MLTSEMNGSFAHPLILAIGGGKGGVGKSMVSSNLAVLYSQAGFRVVLIDLDVGAANLHTIFGIRNPPKGLGDYFLTPRSLLNDYLIPTSLPNLLLAPSSGFVPEMANLRHAQKVKLIHQIKSLEADLVLLDLGAGTSSHVIDFFSMTHAGLVVTTPEPTAIVNAYEFLKNVIYRILFRMFRNQEDLLQVVKTSLLSQNALNVTTLEQLIQVIEKDYPWAAKNIREVCLDLDFYLVLNQSRQLQELQLGKKLHGICERFLNLKLNLGGMIFFNEEVSASVFKMNPLSVIYPDSLTCQSLKQIASIVLHHVVKKQTSNEVADFEQQYAEVLQNATLDHQRHLLMKKKLQRSQERSDASLLPLGIYDE